MVAKYQQIRVCFPNIGQEMSRCDDLLKNVAKTLQAVCAEKKRCNDKQRSARRLEL
jgi:hypothetical protein